MDLKQSSIYPHPRRVAHDARASIEEPRPSAEFQPNVEKLEASAEKLSSMEQSTGERIRSMSPNKKPHNNGHSANSLRSNRVRSFGSFSFSSPIDETPLEFPTYFTSFTQDDSQEPAHGTHSVLRSPRSSVRSKRSESSSRRSHASNANNMRLAQLPEPEQEGRPLDSPLTHSVTASPSQPHQFDSMFLNTRNQQHGTYEEIIDQDLLPSEDIYTRQILEGNSGDDSRLNEIKRNASTASRSTYVPASLFRDFDGVHYTSITGDISEEAQSISGRQTPSSTNDEVPSEPKPKSKWVEPPPADNMVYYPAPVPVTLNLPKRLSQQPLNATQGQRRSQVLSTIPLEARQSAHWLSRQEGIVEEEVQPNDTQPELEPQSQMKARQSRQYPPNMQKLPPQLRASVFFDHTPVSHNLEVKNGSAMATLESMLDESARAPVPDVTGNSNAAPRKKHRARRSTISFLKDTKPEMAKSEGRQSRASIFSRPRSSTDKMSQIRESNYSRLSITSERDEQVQRPSHAEDSTLLSPNNAEEGNLSDTEVHLPGQADSEQDEASGSEREEDDESDPEEENDPVAELEHYHGPPTTLLAELQLRKHQQRQRNRTAVTAFPNGMHSTLLELDAVAQVERKKRNAARTTLAWEEPNKGSGNEKDDDDVPLGMLYPEYNGLVNKKRGTEDWDRPLGLIEKREMEDNEPLSRRRNRLKGIDPRKVALEAQAAARAKAEEEDAAEKSEHEGETLAERTRRLKTKKALDDAIGADDGGNRPDTADFTTELMSQFGDPEKLEEEKRAKDAATKNNAEETLGQRRRRLQAEALAAANGAEATSSGAVPLRSSQSLANLLAANPLSSFRQDPKSSQLAGLVGQSEQQRATRRQDLIDKNQRSATQLMDGPLVDLPKYEEAAPNASRFAAGKYNDGSGGATMQGITQHRSTSNLMQNFNSAQVDFTTGLLAAQQHISASQQVASANALAHQFAQISGHSPSFPQPQQAQQFPQQNFAHQNMMQPNMNPQLMLQANFGALSNFQNQNISTQNSSSPGYAAPGMYPSFSQTASIMQGAQPTLMTPKQRDNIDRWRQSIT